MGSIRKRLSARKTVDQEAAADQEAETMQAEPETLPAEADQAAGGSDEPRTSPQHDGSD